jgi:DNA-binding NtrC family response regulator
MEVKAEGTLRGGSETVLVVEDDPAVRLQTRHMLERFGYPNATSMRPWGE